MKAVILCGGSGTRLREQTEFLPKPLIQIGGKPMVWHIMKIYAAYGITDFVLALGYKQESFKSYFAMFDEINNDIAIGFDILEGRVIRPLYRDLNDRWRVILSDTGADALKGQRLKMMEKYVMDWPRLGHSLPEDTFMCTYGDGVADINLNKLLGFHNSHGKIATITGVHPAPRFGEIYHEDGLAKSFREKPDGECLTNGGFMVFNKEIFERLNSERDLETEIFAQLVAEKQLMVYHHKGFWKCMDTLRDMGELEEMWAAGKAPWRIWK